MTDARISVVALGIRYRDPVVRANPHSQPSYPTLRYDLPEVAQ